MSIDTLHRVAIEMKSNYGVYTYDMISALTILMKHTYWNIIMTDLNKIKDGHRRNVLCYCIEDIHMVRKHSFVYLNMCMLLPYQSFIKFESSYLMFTIQCGQYPEF